MTERKKVTYDQRLVDAQVETTLELHPRNRNEGKIFDNSDKLSEQSLDSFDKLSEKRIRKKCIGCCDYFTCYQSKKYDYCCNCELNGSRYINKNSKCSECDGSGLVKFKGQTSRNCKTCYLTRQEKRKKDILFKHA
jgi:hypothetical protein